MEEKMLLERGLRELDSSGLQMRGGAESAIGKLFEKIRNIIDTVMDYLPNFFKGFKDGFFGTQSK